MALWDSAIILRDQEPREKLPARCKHKAGSLWRCCEVPELHSDIPPTNNREEIITALVIACRSLTAQVAEPETPARSLILDRARAAGFAHRARSF
jgi:hypothetical protein